MLNKSITINNVFGIPLKFNITLILLFLLVLMGQSFITAVFMFSVLLFSVTVHEYAHALTARYFGFKTEDITLFFFGGLARINLDKMKPIQELLITVAGPLSNIALAILTVLFVGFEVPESGSLSPSSYFVLLNVLLGVFNLIPAFPMDGGRILRSSLQILKVKKANQITYWTSRAMTILLFILGLVYASPNFIIIALFLYIAAPKELK